MEKLIGKSTENSIPVISRRIDCSLNRDLSAVLREKRRVVWKYCLGENRQMKELLMWG